MFKVIVAGSRTFNDHKFIHEQLDLLLGKVKDLCIIEGGCYGPDEAGKNWAKLRGHDLVTFHANWKRHDKAAGPIRNEKMAQYAQALICFWDGKSSGTKNMIELAKKYNLRIKIIHTVNDYLP